MQPGWVLDDILFGPTAIAAANVALIDGDQEVTFGDIARRAAGIRAALSAAGVGSRDRIAFLSRRGLGFLDVLFGAATSRVVTVPINWRLARPEIASIIRDAAPRIVFVDEAYEEAVLGAARQADLADPPSTIRLGASFDGWLTTMLRRAGPNQEGTRSRSRPDDVVVQMYTSGTTGLPKGVMLTHANLAGMVGLGERLTIGADSVTLAGLPLFHIGGAGWVLMAMAAGAASVVLPDFSGGGAVAAMERRAVTHAVLVPAMLQEVCAALEAGPQELSALERVVYGASPISDDLLRRSMKLLGCEFCQWYGMTETTGAVTELDPVDHLRDAALLRSAGRALPGVELCIVDEVRRPVDDGVVGEVTIRSSQVTPGYWQNPDATSAAITADGWLHTGDAGYVADGYLFLCDRIKDMIVSGGENIYPAEVENALMAHPDVVEVGVFGVPSARWGEEVAAAVVLREGSITAAEELVGFARTRIAGYKVPKRVEFHEALPRNASGKILRRQLREPHWARLARDVN